MSSFDVIVWNGFNDEVSSRHNTLKEAIFSAKKNLCDFQYIDIELKSGRHYYLSQEEFSQFDNWKELIDLYNV